LITNDFTTQNRTKSSKNNLFIERIIRFLQPKKGNIIDFTSRSSSVVAGLSLHTNITLSGGASSASLISPTFPKERDCKQFQKKNYLSRHNTTYMKHTIANTSARERASFAANSS
jgi:hypothetical protein